MLLDNTTSFFNESIYETDDTTDIPYELPNCPRGSRFFNAFNSPDSFIEALFYSTADKVLISKVLPFIVTLGLLTNSAFLWTILRVSEMRTITNFYLANLACADLFYIIVSGSNKFYSYVWSSDFSRFVPWKSAAGCALVNGFTYVTFFGSLSLITLVSIERFLAICYPLKHRMMNDKSRTIKMSIGAWLIAIVLSALVAPAWGRHDAYCILWPEKYQHRFPFVVHICQGINPDFVDIASICQFFPFVVALCLNTILYSLIVKRLSQRGIGCDQSRQQIQAQRVRNSVALMLVINGIVFFLCLSPYQFFQMYYFAQRHGGPPFLTTKQAYVLGWVGRCSSLLNSAINPLIYSAMNGRYRRAFLSAISCCKCRQTYSDNKGTSPSHSSPTN